LKEEERLRVERLGKEAIRWHKSQIIRSYIEAATKNYIQKRGAIDPGCEFDKWLARAIEQAERLNAFT
jgi:hypothetical protein